MTAKDAYYASIGTRKLLEHSFLALLDSGIDSRGQDVGVYMSGIPYDVLSMADQVSTRHPRLIFLILVLGCL
jgi:hypothetical protein